MSSAVSQAVIDSDVIFTVCRLTQFFSRHSNTLTNPSISPHLQTLCCSPSLPKKVSTSPQAWRRMTMSSTPFRPARQPPRQPRSRARSHVTPVLTSSLPPSVAVQRTSPKSTTLTRPPQTARMYPGTWAWPRASLLMWAWPSLEMRALIRWWGGAVWRGGT